MNKEVFLSALLLDSLIFIKGRQVFYTKIKNTAVSHITNQVGMAEER